MPRPSRSFSLHASMLRVRTRDDALAFLASSAHELGFDFVSYGRRTAFPLDGTNADILTNYPLAWQRRYSEEQYIKIDPSIPASRQSMLPITWDHALFESTPKLWSEARDFGLRNGCAQFVSDAQGNRGMLSLARTHDTISDHELREKSADILWLAALVHEHYAQIFQKPSKPTGKSNLTKREIGILRLTAEGHTATEIAQTIPISAHTVNFHFRNILIKLSASNKTQAALQAAMRGLLD